MVRTAPGQPGSPAGLQDPPGGPGSYTARERVASLIRRRHLSPYLLLLPSVAAIDGAGPVRIFWRIMLPLVAPGLVATSVFAFIFAWNEFVFALTFLGTDTAKFTLPIYVQYFYGRGSVDWGGIMAASTLFTVPVMIFFLIVQRRMASGLVAGAVKG
jgi:N,N'-diacetylchitobiose transport system permease protein